MKTILLIQGKREMSLDLTTQLSGKINNACVWWELIRMVFLLHLPLNQNLKSIQNRNQKSSLEKKTVFSLHFPCESDLSGLIGQQYH